LVIPGAFCTGKLSEKFESFDIEADAIQETLFCDKLALVHVEFQSGPDTKMAQRLLEYLVMAYRRYKCPVISYVIYLKKCALPKPPLVLTLPNGEECLRLNYKVIALHQTPYEELLAKGLKGLLPLIPFALNGARRDVVEELIMRLLPAHDTVEKELLTLLQLFASLAFDAKDIASQEWLKRRFKVLNDILRETPAYQWILEEGREEERVERLRFLHDFLVETVQDRFPMLVSEAKILVERMQDVKVLEDLTRKISRAPTLEIAEQYLSAAKQRQAMN